MEAIPLLLQVLAGFARNRDQKDVADYLELAGELIGRGDTVRDELMALTDEVRQMAELGQSPTVEQLESVRARRQQLSDELRALGSAPDPNA